MARFRRPAADGPQTFVDDLPVEQQRAYELLDTLQVAGDLKGVMTVVRACGIELPVGPNGLARVAACFTVLGMPFSNAGLKKFKEERQLSGGTAITYPVAQAYVRAVKGNEVLFMLTRAEVASLKPNEYAAYEFLRKYAKVKGTEPVQKLKKALGMGNPKIKGAAAKLKNVYVGITTVKELAHQVWKVNVPLTPGGIARLAAALAEQGVETDA